LGDQKYESFHEPEPNLIAGNAGFSVKIPGRTGIRYIEGDRSVRVDSEVPAKPGAMALFKDSIKMWQGEHPERVSMADRERIADNIRRAFEFCGYELQVQESFDWLSVAIRPPAQRHK